MSARDTLSKITNLLGMKAEEQVEMSETKQPKEVEKLELAQAKLENGTVLEAESFSPDNEIFIISDDERVPLPVGEYEMEDGKKLVISEEGVIGEISSSESEEVEEVEAASDDKEEMKYATKEEMSEVKTMIEDLANRIEEMAKPKEEMSSQVKEETPSFKHSPEREEKKQMFRYETNRPANVMDRILQNLNK